VHGAVARSNVILTSPLVIANTKLIVPLVGTPPLGGSSTGRAASPALEYSQMSPSFAATGLAVGGPAGEVVVVDGLGASGAAGIWRACGAVGIWPQPAINTAIPTSAGALARSVASTVVLCHALIGFPGSDKLVNRCCRSQGNTPAHCAGRAA
jgi:hypothetical protein